MTISFNIQTTKSVSGSDKIVTLFEECGLQESVVNLDNGHMNYVATENGMHYCFLFLIVQEV